MKKIGIIIQRYGDEINGGAEHHAKILAEKLSSKYNIEIITTRSIDHNDWGNYYKNSQELIKNIKINRFSSDTKNQKKFRKYRRLVLKNTKTQQLFKKIGIHDFLDSRFDLFTPSKNECQQWLKEIGPYCPKLIEFLELNQNKFDCFIFFTYLFYPTALGMSTVADKSIFIPTVHDEPLLYSKPYDNLFSLPKFIMFNTISEKKLVENTFPNFTKNYDIAGIGIEENINIDVSSIETKYHFNFQYLLYIGRVEGGKGCNELINFYTKSNFQKDIKLVFVGKNYIKKQSTENIMFTGFVNDTTKQYLLNNCTALIIPSKYESLSLVTLEAMIHKKIVVANHNCEVLRDHIKESNSGYTYTDQISFEKVIKRIQNLSAHKKEELEINGYNYVTSKYTWQTIIQKFENAISFITSNN